MVLVEAISAHWILTVMPRIITHNFKTTLDSEKSIIASYYFISYLVGLIVGSLLWPSIVRYLSKSNCLLLGLTLQAFFCVFIGRAQTTLTLGVFRFLFGMSNTINTVGKDFIYDFVDPDSRQFVFTFRSMAVLISSLAGPVLGFYIYYGTGESFKISMVWIAALLLSASLFFFIVFVLIFPLHDVDYVQAEEETQVLIENHHQAKPDCPSHKQLSLLAMIKFIWTHETLRNSIFGAFFVFAVYNTQMFITFYYMEINWSEGGLGLSDKQVSHLALFMFVPILGLYLASPKIIPKYISIYSLFRVILITNILLLMMLPTLRDLLATLTIEQRNPIISTVICLYFVFNLNFISPFLNFHMNNLVPKNGRTSFNSLTFLGVCSGMILVNFTIVRIFSGTMYDPMFLAFAPFNKYISFFAFSALLLAALWLLWGPQNKKREI